MIGFLEVGTLAGDYLFEGLAVLGGEANLVALISGGVTLRVLKGEALAAGGVGFGSGFLTNFGGVAIFFTGTTAFLVGGFGTTAATATGVPPRVCLFSGSGVFFTGKGIL